MAFQVARRQCGNCLFSRNKIVSDKAKIEVLDQCRRNDTYFVCHHASMKNKEICCRGFYEKDPGATNLMRIAARLGAVDFVDV